MSSRDVDVVILTWNDGELLDVAMRSALESDRVIPHVVVVDNGSDPPVTVMRDPRVHLLRNDHNRGVAAGRNQGVAIGNSQFVCLLDSDARLSSSSLDRLVAAIESDVSIGVAVPVFAGQRPTASAGAAPSLGRKLLRVAGLTSTYRGGERPPDAPFWEVDFGIGACQVFRRAVFDAVGGLDESIFYGPEDVDFCLRVADHGWRVVQVPDAPVQHPPRRRNRQLLTRRGIQHSIAVLRHLRRHRRHRSFLAR